MGINFRALTLGLKYQLCIMLDTPLLRSQVLAVAEPSYRTQLVAIMVLNLGLRIAPRLR